MSRMLLTSLVLIPVLAHAEARKVSEPKQTTSSVVLEAELKQPAGLAEVAMAAAEAPITVGTANVASHAGVRQSIKASFSNDFIEAAMRQGGTLEYSLKGSVPTQASAPRVTKAVELELSQEELTAQPTVSNVVVRATVDEYGIPRNVAVTQSAGKVVDQKAIVAVGQYRFKPAMVDNQPTPATVSIAIKISK
jgi:TonB family protein